MGESTIRVKLSGVPETLLWPLYSRASETQRTDALLQDPKAVEVMDSIDYPFEENFGRPGVAFPLRALCFDEQVKDFIKRHPRGTVVALGDGLETQFWRVDNGQVRWLSVDLPETISLRQQLLPDTDRFRNLSCSALDHRWMDEVDPDNGVFITAQGLFMYFDESEVKALIAECAERFADGGIMFDTMPKWLTKQSGQGTWLSRLMMRGRDDQSKSYQLPPMHWGTNLEGVRKLRELHPNITGMKDVLFPQGRGFVFGFVNPRLGHSALIRNRRPCMAVFRFGQAA